MTTDSPQIPDDALTTPESTAPAGLPLGIWTVSLLLAAAVGWAGLNFIPVKPKPPEKFVGVDMYSPADLQKEADAYFLKVKKQVRFRQMTILGGLLGLAPLLFFGFTRRSGWLAGGIVALVAGVLLGVANGDIGERVRTSLGPEVKIPLVDDGNRLVVVDAIVYASVSIVLLFPIAIAFGIGRERQRFQKAFAVVLAGLLAGGLLPIAASQLMPTAQTNHFPPVGIGLTALWLSMLAVLTAVVTTMLGSQKDAARAGSAPDGE